MINVLHIPKVGNTLYVSGQLGMVPDKMEFVTGGTVPEARQALVNMGHILEAAKTDFANVVHSNVRLADIKDFEAVNNVYKEFFQNNYPARFCFEVR